jgi:rifampicin phosphotransferase
MQTKVKERYILPLDGISREDLGKVGVKAANLGELLRGGFQVPGGFVVTTEAFSRFLAANSLGSDAHLETVANASVPGDVAEEWGAELARMGEVPLAVRSSGVAEDLPDASFAGQYETVLDVRGADALTAAIRRCWASAFSERVVKYRSAQRQNGNLKMAVLVQRLVQPDAAGVAFTANPVTGDLGEVVVSAVKGLGERLVSGQASPDEWVVRGSEAICRSAPERAVDAAQVKAVADLARRVEKHFGNPQDIEWAIAGSKLFLLQARPITALTQKGLEQVPVPVEVPPGFWERESHYPQPLSPIFRTSFVPAHAAGMMNMCSELSFPFEKIDFREIGGWSYHRLVPLGGKDRKTPPNWLMYLLIRLVPQMRSRIKGMAQNLRNDMPGAFIDKWYNEWRPGQEKHIAELRAVDVAKLSDEELERHLTAAMSLMTEGLRIHGLVSGIDIASALLAFTCRDLLNWDDKQTMSLLTGLSTTTSEASQRVADMAQMAKKRPALLKLLESGDDDIVGRLASIAPEFAEAFAAYQKDFGCRAMAFEVTVPTVAETPSLTLGLIRDQVLRSYDPKGDTEVLSQERTAALAAAKRALAGHSPEDRQRFERDLARAQRGYPIREDHEFYLSQAPLALLRYAVLEAGQRFAKRSQIAERDDVFFLELPELRVALVKGGDCRPLVQRRKGERAWVESHPGPTSYGKSPGPPPSLAPFPREARLMMEGVLWMMEGMYAPNLSAQVQKAGQPITGIAASAGRYTGPVRVIMNETEFGKLRAGDILVCPTTSPVWAVLFPSVGALVTDSGGILSHPAIIAREHRVPAVVATGNATQLLKDRQIVTVDGSSGLVRVQS